MKITPLAIATVFAAAAFMMIPDSADAQMMTGKWSNNSASGKLQLRVNNGKAQMKVFGSCNSRWMNTSPNAFEVQGGKLVLVNSSFSLPIGGKCGNASVTARKKGNGFSFSFRNRYTFNGSVN